VPLSQTESAKDSGHYPFFQSHARKPRNSARAKPAGAQKQSSGDQRQNSRSETRRWVMKRRERTRRLIELGGLVVKPGLIELTDDDRVVLLGLLAEAAAKLRTEHRVIT
jgi:hypothetical protein